MRSSRFATGDYRGFQDTQLTSAGDAHSSNCRTTGTFSVARQGVWPDADAQRQRVDIRIFNPNPLNTTVLVRADLGIGYQFDDNGANCFSSFTASPIELGLPPIVVAYFPTSISSCSRSERF